MAKNVLPKHWNGSEFEELHIVTKASNVFTNDNKSVQQKIDDFTSHLADGTQHSKTARFVVGTSTSGWTAADCDYLCDGTNDQVEIQNAINALPATGGEIIILDGIYNITAPINVVKNNVVICGNGDATTLIRKFDSSGTQAIVLLSGVNRCIIKNMFINGNKTQHNTTQNETITIQNGEQNVVENITFDDCRNSFVRIKNSNKNRISNCLGNSANTGINVRGNDNVIVDNFLNNTTYGVSFSSVSNCNIVRNNIIKNSESAGINLQSGTAKNLVHGNTVSDSERGVLVVSSSLNSICENIFTNNEIGIMLQSSDSNIVLGNSIIRGTGTASDYSSTQHTIQLYSTGNDYNLIVANNCMGKAVVVEGGTGNSAWGNKFDATNDLP